MFRTYLVGLHHRKHLIKFTEYNKCAVNNISLIQSIDFVEIPIWMKLYVCLPQLFYLFGIDGYINLYGLILYSERFKLKC